MTVKTILATKQDELPNEPIVISLEDVMSLSDDQAAVMELDQDLTIAMEDLQQLNDLELSLECLAEIGEEVKESTYTELALMDLTAHACAVNIGMESEDFLPELEECLGQQVSMEAIKKAGKLILDGFFLLLEKIIEGIKRVWIRATSAISHIRRQLEATKQRLEGMDGGASTEKEFFVDSGLRSLLREGKEPKNFSDIILLLDSTNRTTEWLFGDYLKLASERINTIHGGLGEFEPKKDVDMDALYGAFEKLIIPMTDKTSDIFYLKGLTGALRGKGVYGFAPLDKVTTAILPGNNELVGLIPHAKSSAQSNRLSRAAVTRTQRVFVRKWDPKLESVDSGKLESPTKAELLSMIESGLRVCSTIEDGVMSSLYMKTDKTCGKITGTAKKLRKVVEKDKTITSEVRDLTKSAIQFSKTAHEWGMLPHAKVTPIVIAALMSANRIAHKAEKNFK